VGPAHFQHTSEVQSISEGIRSTPAERGALFSC
jgi:hypothetical protein